MPVEIIVYPEPSLYDEDIVIVVKGLSPLKPYTLHSCTTFEKSEEWFESLAHYVSDKAGVIDLTKQPSVSGNYKGVESMGLFWSMEPSPKNKRPYAATSKIRSSDPLIVTMNVYSEKIQSLEELHSRECLVETVVTRLLEAPGVSSKIIRDNGLYAYLYLPPGDGPFPGVINIAGILPGTYLDKPALLASHGYATLGLPYHGMDGLPEHYVNQQFDLRYFEAALQFMQNHEKVQRDKGIGLATRCGGVAFGLAMLNFLPGIACFIGSNGPLFNLYQPLKYGTAQCPPAVVPIDHRLSEKCKETNAIVSRSMIPIPETLEKLKSHIFDFYNHRDVPFLFFGSLDDDAQAAEYYANMAEKLLRSANHPNYEVYRYPGAGHMFGEPYAPHNYVFYLGEFKSLSRWGGVRKPHHKGEKHAWKKQLEFLERNLKRKRVVGVKSNL